MPSFWRSWMSAVCAVCAAAGSTLIVTMPAELVVGLALIGVVAEGAERRDDGLAVGATATAVRSPRSALVRSGRFPDAVGEVERQPVDDRRTWADAICLGRRVNSARSPGSPAGSPLRHNPSTPTRSLRAGFG